MVGTEFPPSEWVTVTQDRINAFANATNDHQWIHTDPARAAKEVPGGKTIAHGYLTLSLLPFLAEEIYRVDGCSRVINYGADKLRFTAPVPSGSRVRLRQTIKEAEEGKGRVKVVAESVLEVEGAERPAMVADIIFLYFL